jgi:hypothetical protein
MLNRSMEPVDAAAMLPQLINYAGDGVPPAR